MDLAAWKSLVPITREILMECWELKPGQSDSEIPVRMKRQIRDSEYGEPFIFCSKESIKK